MLVRSDNKKGIKKIYKKYLSRNDSWILKRDFSILKYFGMYDMGIDKYFFPEIIKFRFKVEKIKNHNKNIHRKRAKRLRNKQANEYWIW